jgi:hypothetical protein
MARSRLTRGLSMAERRTFLHQRYQACLEGPDSVLFPVAPSISRDFRSRSLGAEPDRLTSLR